jgi:hypothetical protein
MIRTLLHPIGWCTAIAIGGGTLAILALEQAALMSIVVSRFQGQSIGTIPALRFIVARSVGELLRNRESAAKLFLNLRFRKLWPAASRSLIGARCAFANFDENNLESCIAISEPT